MKSKYQQAVVSAVTFLRELLEDLNTGMSCIALKKEFRELGKLLLQGEKIELEAGYYRDCKDKNLHLYIRLAEAVIICTDKLETLNGIEFTKEPDEAIKPVKLRSYKKMVAVIPFQLHYH